MPIIEWRVKPREGIIINGTKIKRKPKRLKHVRHEVWKYLLEQSSQSSVHGFDMLMKRKIHWFERFFWLMSIVAAAVCIVYLSTPLFKRYKTSPTVMSVEIDNFNWNVTFPAITLCPYNKVDPQNLEKLLQDYKEEDRNNISLFISTLAAVNLNTVGDFELKNNDLILPKDYAKVVAMVFPDIGKLQITSNTNVPFTRDSVMTELGMCGVINSNVAHHDNPSNWKASSALHEKRSVELNVHDGIFFIQTVNFSDIYKIFIHSPNEVVDSTSTFYIQQYHTFVSINIFTKSTRSSQDVKDLSIHQRNCRYIDEPIPPRDIIYSYNRCLKECRLKIIKVLCRCVPYFYKSTAEERICSLAELSCLVDYRKELQRLSIPPIPPIFSQPSVLPESVRDCGCVQSCEENVFIEDNVEISPAKLTLLRVGLEVYPKVRYTREIIFGFYDVLVRAGGVMNLCLGMSVISVAEHILFFYIKPLLIYLRLCYRGMMKKVKLRN